MSWDRRWMDLALLVASWSKDRSRRTGAVIVDQRNVLLAIGWNGFPRGVYDAVDERHLRPQKYQWTEHAERNAIYNAASHGIATLDARMYLPWFPCADCARAIIQSGISEIVAAEPDWNDPTWGSDFRLVAEMFDEVKMKVRFMDAAPITVEVSA